MFNLNKNNSPLSSSFDEPVFKNQQYIKNLQQSYLNNGFHHSTNHKQSRIDHEKQLKSDELQQYNIKNQQYLSDIAQNRRLKQNQKNFLAAQYDEMIKNRKMKEEDFKRYQINMEKQILKQPTWIRDSSSERQINRKKINYYSQELQKHVQAQEARKHNQTQREQQMKKKINAEADEILRKQYEEMQRRYARKSQFQQRQNNLLGIHGFESPRSNRTLEPSRQLSPEQQLALKRQQKQVYEKGLNLQLGSEEQRKKKQVSHHFTPGNAYNPITNPVPIVYKNPNVLRMLSQK